MHATYKLASYLLADDYSVKLSGLYCTQYRLLVCIMSVLLNNLILQFWICIFFGGKKRPVVTVYYLINIRLQSMLFCLFVCCFLFARWRENRWSKQEKPAEIPAVKSNGSRHFVWEALVNIGRVLRRCIFFFMHSFSVQLIWVYSVVDRLAYPSNFIGFRLAQDFH